VKVELYQGLERKDFFLNKKHFKQHEKAKYSRSRSRSNTIFLSLQTISVFYEYNILCSNVDRLEMLTEYGARTKKTTNSTCVDIL